MTSDTDNYNTFSLEIITSDRQYIGQYDVRLSNNYLDYEDHRSGDVYSSDLFTITIHDCPAQSLTRNGGVIPR